MTIEGSSLWSRLRPLARTPLHPQWFALRDERRLFAQIGHHMCGRVIDIGCSDSRIRPALIGVNEYIGLDYPATATAWYRTLPQVFGDAHSLPFAKNSVDGVLLLDVMEHLVDPTQCLKEIHSVLRPDGILALKVPFLYPIHDAPRDFGRWSAHGLERLLEVQGFTVDLCSALGHPLHTAALLSNIALAKTVLNWISVRNPLALLAITLPFAFLLTNVLAALAAMLSAREDFMPHSYLVIARRK